MEHKNSIEFKLTSKTALFSDPLTRVGGEKFSYSIPTYQALCGITESIYWKPTFIWVIDSVRIINPIKTEAKGMRPILYSEGSNTLSIYTYLTDVEYRVRAHFEWNENRPDLIKDRNENKHFFIAKRMIEKGGRRDIFLGTRECQGYAESCDFNDGMGTYDNTPELSFGMMFHGFNYPDTSGKNELSVRFWQPSMKNGVINFLHPCEFTPDNKNLMIRKIKDQKAKVFTEGINFSSVDLLYEEEGGVL